MSVVGCVAHVKTVPVLLPREFHLLDEPGANPPWCQRFILDDPQLTARPVGRSFPIMPAPLFHANADYIVIDRSPLVLAAGTSVRVGASDRVWPGWVSVASPDGRTTFVPADRLDILPDGTGVMLDCFDATDLSVRQGDKIVSLREVDGWHWARNTGGQEGWLPGYVLDPA